MFALRYIVHVRISLDVDSELQVVFVRLKEGMFSAQCSMRLKKVAEGLALECLVVNIINSQVYSLKQPCSTEISTGRSPCNKLLVGRAWHGMTWLSMRENHNMLSTDTYIEVHCGAYETLIHK